MAAQDRDSAWQEDRLRDIKTSAENNMMDHNFKSQADRIKSWGKDYYLCHEQQQILETRSDESPRLFPTVSELASRYILPDGRKPSSSEDQGD